MTALNNSLFTIEQLEALRTYVKHEAAAAVISNENLDENGMPIRTPNKIISMITSTDHAFDLMIQAFGVTE